MSPLAAYGGFFILPVRSSCSDGLRNELAGDHESAVRLGARSTSKGTRRSLPEAFCAVPEVFVPDVRHAALRSSVPHRNMGLFTGFPPGIPYARHLGGVWINPPGGHLEKPVRRATRTGGRPWSLLAA